MYFCKYCKNGIIRKNGVWVNNADYGNQFCRINGDLSDKKHEPDFTKMMRDLMAAIKISDKEKVDNIACRLFITDNGQCDWGNIRAFELLNPGIGIFAIEEDSFGWLIGGIRYENKVFSYG